MPESVSRVNEGRSKNALEARRGRGWERMGEDGREGCRSGELSGF